MHQEQRQAWASETYCERRPRRKNIGCRLEACKGDFQDKWNENDEITSKGGRNRLLKIRCRKK